MSKNLYADIFSAPEEDVKTFAEVMKIHNRERPQGLDISQGGFDEVMSGKAQQVAIPEFITQESGLLVFEHGWLQEDYIYHLQPRRGKDWRVSPERVTFAIAKTLDTVIPRTMRVNIYPPYEDWEIKAYTVKVLGLRAAWQVPPSDITRLTEKLFSVLNALV
jgi:hypothetical protein